MVSDSENPCVEYEDVVSEQGELNKDLYSKDAQKSGIIFTEKDVLYGKLRPYLHNWLNPDFRGVAVGDWWVLRPINLDKNFLYWLIQTPQYDTAANQSSGTKMPRADWKLVSNTEFYIPASVEEQAKLAEVFDSLDNLITLHQRKLNKNIKCEKSKMNKYRSIKKRGRRRTHMLKIIMGNDEKAIYNTSVYFKNSYTDDWIMDEFSAQMIKDVDKSIVVGPNLIQSPVLGAISPRELSGGVKTLILIYKDRTKVFNASTCGDNCAKWLLRMSKSEDITINLRHLMDFGTEEFEIEVLNTHQIVRNMKQFIDVAGELV